MLETVLSHLKQCHAFLNAPACPLIPNFLRCSQINYFIGRGEERLWCLQAVKKENLQTSWVLFSFLKGTNYFFGTINGKENINRCLCGLRMEDQGEQSPQTLLVNNFSFLQPRRKMYKQGIANLNKTTCQIWSVFSKVHF